jgi:hypothetical protein
MYMDSTGRHRQTDVRAHSHIERSHGATLGGLRQPAPAAIAANVLPATSVTRPSRPTSRRHKPDVCLGLLPRQ